MARFDGQTGVSVPSSVVSADAFPSHKFTIATWMRHRDNKALEKHIKEHIICKADDHRKYHSSIFIPLLGRSSPIFQREPIVELYYHLICTLFDLYQVLFVLLFVL